MKEKKIKLKDENQLKQEIWKLHSTGIPSHEIADRLELDRNDVEEKIQEISRDIADVISKQTAMEMTAEIVNRYDYLFKLCLEEFSNAGAKEKALFLRIATSINKNKEELLKDTGLIPKEAQKLEYTIKGRIQHDHKIMQDEERTDEEIEQNIAYLLRYGLVLGEGKETRDDNEEDIIDVEYKEKDSENREKDIKEKDIKEKDVEETINNKEENIEYKEKDAEGS